MTHLPQPAEPCEALHARPVRPEAERRLSGRLILSAAGTLALGGFLWLNWRWIGDAVALVRAAGIRELGGALGLILLSYLISSQVFHVALRSLGRNLGVLPLWTTTVTAIVISQAVPAGGAGSYAFLLSAFKRRGVPAGEAALLAMLEALSYAGALILVGVFSLVYILFHVVDGLGAGGLVAPAIAGLVGVVCLAAVGLVLTRDELTLRGWIAPVGRALARLRLRPGAGNHGERVVAELVRARGLLAARPGAVVVLVAIQIVALAGHSLALHLILASLGASAGFGLTLAAFGVALLTSTFNVLPGGGGAVETVLAAVLMNLAVGPAAIPAAILFRLLNFWAMSPIAIAGYFWLRRPHPPGLSGRQA
jgi:uncharacterized membrane protein YbhN (UPF0104 family)